MSKKTILVLASLVLGIGFFGRSLMADPSSNSKSAAPSTTTSVSTEAALALANATAYNKRLEDCQEMAHKINAASIDCANAAKAKAIGDPASKTLESCAKALDCGDIAVKAKEPEDSEDEKNAESDEDIQKQRKEITADEANKAKANISFSNQDSSAKDDNDDLQKCQNKSEKEKADVLRDEAEKQLVKKDEADKKVSDLQKEIVDLRQKAASDASAKTAEINRLTLDNQATQAQIQTQVQSQDIQAGMALDKIKTQQNQLAAKLLVINGGTEYQAALVDYNLSLYGPDGALTKCRAAMAALGAQNKLANPSLGAALSAASQSQANGGTGGFTNNFCSTNYNYVAALQAANQKLALVRTRLAEETTEIAVQQADLNQQASRIVQNAHIVDDGAIKAAATKVTANQITIKADTDQLSSAAAALDTNTKILNNSLENARQKAQKASDDYANYEGQLDTLHDAGVDPDGKGKGSDKEADKISKLLTEVKEGATASSDIQGCQDQSGKKLYDSWGNSAK